MQKSTVDLVGVLELLNIYFEARNSMQSKAATTTGLLVIIHAVPENFVEIQYMVTSFLRRNTGISYRYILIF